MPEQRFRAVFFDVGETLLAPHPSFNELFSEIMGGLGYEVTPDDRAILSEDPRLRGLFHASGFSGHGIMHAPATGELIAELIVDGKTSLDISALGASRFCRGQLVPEHNVI